jgi:hypothetical protein
MPKDFGERLRMEWSVIKPGSGGDLTALVWKGKQNVNMLTNMHRSPAEGNLCDDHRNSLK